MLRENLVDQDGSNRVDLLMRLEVQEFVWDRPPHAGGLVGLAGIGGDEVLEQRVSRLRDILVRDGDEMPEPVTLIKTTIILPASRFRLPDSTRDAT